MRSKLFRAFSQKIWQKDIVSEYGRAKVVTATNVFAHMAPLGEVMRGIKALLDHNGVFVTESHYLLDVLQKQQYDTIYHEHIRTYSLKSLMTLFNFYDMEVFDVRRADRYGGNIRAYVANKSTRTISKNVLDLVDLEKKSGLGDSFIYENFRNRAFQTRDELMELAYRAKVFWSELRRKFLPWSLFNVIEFLWHEHWLNALSGRTTDVLKIEYVSTRHAHTNC